jgi:O-glycosyl hydrolase
MTKKLFIRFTRSICILLLMVQLPAAVLAQPSEIKLELNGAVKFQTMDGFGVNINPAWWYNGEYTDAAVEQPAIDLLIDSLGAAIFRIVVEEIDWEAVNDDNDPDHFNWEYYNSVFSGTKFKGIWNTLHYLNKRGIKDGLCISFMGAPPSAPPLEKPDQKQSWMGDTPYSIRENMEEEFAESEAAFLYYMRNVEKISFSLVSPMNETDIISMTRNAEHPVGLVEGPDVPDAAQWVRIMHKLAMKLDKNGMSDIRFVAPDAGGDKLFYGVLSEMVNDKYLMDKLKCWGVHQYGNDSRAFMDKIRLSPYPTKPFWVTETARISHLFGQLDDNAGSYIFWDGFDCVYQHGRRNGYGSVPPNDWVFWFGPGEGKPLLEYLPATQSWKPRKTFWQYAQLMKFIRPGSVRVSLTGQDSTLSAYVFCNPDGSMVITGLNTAGKPVELTWTVKNLPAPGNMKLVYTDSLSDMKPGKPVTMSGKAFKALVPAKSVFTITGNSDQLSSAIKTIKPEPDNWYAGDIHIHRNCGDGTSVLAESEFTSMMEPNNLAVISVLADMGDGEVKDSFTDLPKVNGSDAIQSKTGRLVHWDAEWHFDPFGTTFEHKALGGHLVFLGLKEAHTIWDESPYKVIEWGKSQDAVIGFCHLQYLNDAVQNDLDCCIPVDYPVEAALGTIDFLSEDVWLNDAAINAYYKILNCGFRLGWAAGTDFPCNNSRPFGSLLTYVQVKDQPMTYRKWVEGIKNGRTVVTTNGHAEFLDFHINGSASPGDEIKLTKPGSISADVDWTAAKELTGRIEFVCNGKVVAATDGTASPGKPVHFSTKIKITESSWICARRMDATGHCSHTAPIFVPVMGKPVRASEADARFFIAWIDNILKNIEPGQPWNKYFTHDLDAVKARYIKARSVYEKIAAEAVSSKKVKS